MSRNAKRRIGPRVKGGMVGVDQLRARSKVDPVTHCWHWQGAKTGKSPSIYTVDFGTGTKHVMSGPAAVWNIAHQAAPLRGYKVMRSCGCKDCVNPAHHKEVSGQSELMRLLKASGWLKRECTPAMRESMARARAAQGIVDTPEHLVLAIRAEPEEATSQQIADKYGMKKETVRRLRTAERRAAVAAAVLPAPESACTVVAGRSVSDCKPGVGALARVAEAA